MKKFICFLATFGLLLSLATACEPEDCRKLKDSVCKHCGPTSAACKSIKKRHGRDEKKCQRGLAHLKRHTKDENSRKTFCGLLNDNVKKK